MKKARYICFEGCDGVGKTTQVELLYQYLLKKKFKVLKTREPGTEHSPLSLKLREFVLDNKYSKDLTINARELINQAIRSIHLEKIVLPALYEYDFIIQDRGAMSGIVYGLAFGLSEESLIKLFRFSIPPQMFGSNMPFDLYDDVVYLYGDLNTSLKRALNKKEFIKGDYVESQGDMFFNLIDKNFIKYSDIFNTKNIYVDNKTIEEVHLEVLSSLKL